MTIERQTSRISDGGLLELFSLGDLCLSDFVDAPAEDIKKMSLNEERFPPGTSSYLKENRMLIPNTKAQ